MSKQIKAGSKSSAMKKLRISFKLEGTDGQVESDHDWILPIDPSVDYGHNLQVLIEHCQLLFSLLIAKGYSYGASWKKRGEQRSWIPNMDRKWDRFDQSIINNTPRSRIDSVADLGNYSILGLEILRELYPEEYSRWIMEEVTPFLKEYFESLGHKFPPSSSK